MIVCSCNVISHRDIEATVAALRDLDPNVVLTAGLVYRTMGHRPKCGNCLSHIVRMIHAIHTDDDEKQAQK
jgi:bacterioferritin-associated ferredoxin